MLRRSPLPLEGGRAIAYDDITRIKPSSSMEEGWVVV